MGQQLWAVDSLGGYLGNDQLSKQIRHAAQPLMKIRQFVDAEGAIGKNRGDKVLFNKISNISTAGGTIAETATIPKRNYTVRQGSLEVTEYANAIPFTFKAQVLAEIKVPDIVKTVLRNDMAKVLDSAAAVEFQKAKIKCVCTSTASSVFTTDGTATATAAASMSDKNVRDIVDYLKRNNAPRYDGSNYICIASTTSIRGLYDYFETKAQNTTMKPLAAGEVGQYYGCRFIEETSMLSNAKGSDSTYGEALFFGADSVREGIVVPEEIRIDLPKDFGRDQGIAYGDMVWLDSIWAEAELNCAIEGAIL